MRFSVPRSRRRRWTGGRTADLLQPVAHHVGAQEVAFLGGELLGMLALEMGRLRQDEQFVHERAIRALEQSQVHAQPHQ